MHDTLNPFMMLNSLERVDRVTTIYIFPHQVSQQQIWHEVCNQMKQAKKKRHQIPSNIYVHFGYNL